MTDTVMKNMLDVLQRKFPEHVFDCVEDGGRHILSMDGNVLVTRWSKGALKRVSTQLDSNLVSSEMARVIVDIIEGDVE